MVQIGSLSWKVQVEKATEAKKKAEEVGEKVKDTKDAMESANEQSEGLSDKLGGLNDAQELAGKGFDKMNAKAGFFGTALQFVRGSIMAIVGAISSLTALITGVAIAAVVALAIAWKENIGKIRGRVGAFKEWTITQFQALKQTALKAWKAFIQGFKDSGGDIGDLKTIFVGLLDGIEIGLKTVWAAVGPILKAMGGAFITLAAIVGRIIGTIVDVLATLEKEFNLISGLTAAVVAFAGAWATAVVIVEIITAIISVAISFISILGSVMSAIATVISVIGTLISVVSTVISVIAGIIAVLNPVTLAILAIIGVIVALYAAWKTNFFGIRDIVESVVSVISQKIDQAVQVVQGAITDMQQAFDRFVSGAANIGANLINGIINGITNAASGLTNAVSNVVDDVRQYLPFSPANIGPLADLDQVGPGFISTIENGIMNNAGAVRNAVENVAGEAAEYLPWSPAEKGPLSNLEKSGPGLVKTVASGIEDESPRLTKAAEGAAQGVQKGLSSESVRTGEMAKRGGSSTQSESGPQMKKVEINVGGIDVGDQSLDLSNMSRADLRRLAQEIAGELGDEVRSVVS